MKKSNKIKDILITAFVLSVIFALIIPNLGIVARPIPENISDNKYGNWVAVGNSASGELPEIMVLMSNQKRTLIEVSIPGFWVYEKEVEEQTFHEITIPGHTTTMEIGKPMIPIIHALVAVPSQAQIELNCQAYECVILDDYHIYPFQEPDVDDQKYQTGFIMDEEAYGSDEFYPKTIARVNNPSLWRDLHVITLEIAPIAYRADRGLLVVRTQIIIELNYHFNDTTRLLDRPINVVQPHWVRRYQQQIINYDWLDIEIGKIDSPGPFYLIITHPDFEDAIQPLAKWHHKEGFKTEVISINASDAYEIKDLITDRYDQGNLEYVLLVGDKEHMPRYCWEFGGSGDVCLSDYWYACITGPPDDPDMEPDVAVGRLSIMSSIQVENQVAKILAYEKDPPSNDWLNKILLVAHREEAPGKYVECKENIRTDIIPQQSYIVDTLYGHEPSGTNANVAAAINSGRNVVNYRGHGWTEAWEEWSYYHRDWGISNVNALSNGNHTPIVFNIACSCHGINLNCLGEAWLDKYPGGAVASLGSSRPSQTDANHDYDKELFRQFCEYGEYRIGWISNAAATYIITHHGEYGKDNAKMYLWLGDPATEIWTDIPKNFEVEHPAIVPIGASSFKVHVEELGGGTVADAYVCLWKDDEIYLTGYTDTNGDILFDISATTEGALYVTVTKHNYLSFESEAIVKICDHLVYIIRPVKSHLYILNQERRLLPLELTVVIGEITVRVNATDYGNEIERVEFYINDKLTGTCMTEPYTWIWSERSFFRYTLKVVGVTNTGNSTSDEIVLWKFF